MNTPIPNRRSTSDVARLPKKIRNSVNRMLEDGVPYAEIADRLTRRGRPLSEQSVSRWSRAGHRDWLRQQDRLAGMVRTHDFAIDAVKTHKGPVVHHASLFLAASQVYELLTDFDPEVLREKLVEDPATYNRLVTNITRLADEGLKYERYTAEVAERKAKIKKELAKAKPGGISPETRRRIEEELNLM